MFKHIRRITHSQRILLCQNKSCIVVESIQQALAIRPTMTLQSSSVKEELRLRSAQIQEMTHGSCRSYECTQRSNSFVAHLCPNSCSVLHSLPCFAHVQNFGVPVFERARCFRTLKCIWALVFERFSFDTNE